MNIFKTKETKEPTILGENNLNKTKLNNDFLIYDINETHIKPKKANIGFINNLIKQDRTINLKSHSNYSNDLNELVKQEHLTKSKHPIASNLKLDFDVKSTHLNPTKKPSVISKSYDIFNVLLPKNKDGPKYELTAINIAPKSIEEAVELKQEVEKSKQKLLSDGTDIKELTKKLIEKRKPKLSGGFEEMKTNETLKPMEYGDLESDDEIPLENIFGLNDKSIDIENRKEIQPKDYETLQNFEKEYLFPIFSSTDLTENKKIKIKKIIDELEYLSISEKTNLTNNYIDALNEYKAKEDIKDEAKEEIKKEEEEITVFKLDKLFDDYEKLNKDKERVKTKFYNSLRDMNSRGKHIKQEGIEQLKQYKETLEKEYDDKTKQIITILNKYLTNNKQKPIKTSGKHGYTYLINKYNEIKANMIKDEAK